MIDVLMYVDFSTFLLLSLIHVFIRHMSDYVQSARNMGGAAFYDLKVIS